MTTLAPCQYVQDIITARRPFTLDEFDAHIKACATCQAVQHALALALADEDEEQHENWNDVV